MRCKLQGIDVFIIVIYTLLIIDLILNWSEYSTCYEPIQLFLLETYLFIILHRVLTILKSNLELSRIMKTFLVFLIYWVINPGFLVLTAEGIIWQNNDNAYSSKCIPMNRVPWIVDFWIVVLALIDVLVIFITIFKILKWWRIRTNRRRLNLLMNELMIDEHTLHQVLLPNNLNNQIGLSLDDISYLPRVIFSNTISGMFTFGNSCPICCEEFQENEEIFKLPICNHMFHSKCITSWLARNPLCPMCRSNVRNNLESTRNSESQNISLEGVL